MSNGNARQIFGRKQKAKKGEFLPSRVTRKGETQAKVFPMCEEDFPHSENASRNILTV